MVLKLRISIGCYGSHSLKDFTYPSLLYKCFCMVFLGGNSQSSLKMRIKLGKQSVEKAKVDLSGVVS